MKYPTAPIKARLNKIQASYKPEFLANEGKFYILHKGCKYYQPTAVKTALKMLGDAEDIDLISAKCILAKLAGYGVRISINIALVH